MTKYEIDELLKTIKKLELFFDIKNRNETEIVNWVSDCVAIFSKLKVNELIISEFIKYYYPRDLDEVRGGVVDDYLGTNHVIRKMGNFEMKKFSSGYSAEHKSYLANIAFVSAKSLLEKTREEERLVPLWLINILSEENKFSNIRSSLELIEKNYEDGDSDGIVKNSLTLLESILDLDDKLLKCNNLSNKLRELLKQESIRNNFGVTKEFVYALNNSRLLRNMKSVHKTRDINYNIPFLISVSTAYLIILLLELTISTAILIK